MQFKHLLISLALMMVCVPALADDDPNGPRPLGKAAAAPASAPASAPAGVMLPMPLFPKEVPMIKILFLDNRDLEIADGFTRQAHMPVKHQGDPILKSDLPTED